jgi:hypothetical protein
MLLKPRLSNNIALVIGGCILSIIGFGSWILIGGYAGIVLGVFGLLGLIWITVASVAVARRNRMAISIENAGIDLPAFAVFQRDSGRVFIRREDIAAISKHESLKGRLIAITKTNGVKVLVQARHYCGLDDFISYCKNNGLPVE